MKKLSFFLSVLVLVSVFSSVSFGMVVTDTGAYAYWIEQLKAAQQQIKSAQDTLKGVEDVKSEVNSVQQQLTGTYQRGIGLVDALKKVQKALGSNPSNIKNIGDKWKGILSDLDGFVDAKDILDSVYSDPRKNKNDVWAKIDENYQVKQESLKNAIDNCDNTVSSISDRMKALQVLSEQIDQTENMKDAQDLANRFLAEILQILIEHHTLYAQVSEANALLMYSGVDDESMTTRKNEAAAAKEKQDTENFVLPGNYQNERNKLKSGSTDIKTLLKHKK